MKTTVNVRVRNTAGLLARAAVLALAVAVPFKAAHAQDSVEDTEAAPMPSESASGQVYTAQDFARFSPTSAFDMLRQLPGFSIREEDQGRGLGQANVNVLIDGERIATKSESVTDRLGRIAAARVVRIEIVDGATLKIPGLSGQVANVVTDGAGTLSGQFTWRSVVRPHYAHPSFWAGEASITGKGGALEYTVALSNQNGRGAAGGPTLVKGPDGALLERRNAELAIDNENPKLSGQLKWDGPGSSVGNFNAFIRRHTFDLTQDEDRTRPGLTDRRWDYDAKGRDYDYEIGGDFEFAVGPGRLKLIGLERYQHENYDEAAVFSYPDGTAPAGNRYMQITDSGEHIGRAEYGWQMWGGSFQLAAEAAFNRLDQSARLFDLSPASQFVELPFPEGTGGVREDRYEAVLTHSRQLAGNLSLQFGIGGEYSQLSQTGPGGLSRSFRRPKGSASLAWTPQPGLDLSLKLERKVGQLEFGDFLARVFLDDDNQNAGNAQLVPEQEWLLELETKKSLGPWGSTTLRLFTRRVSDFIDVIPVPGGESVGNISGRARLSGFHWESTFNFDPAGWKGAKLDLTMDWENSSLSDPLTGRRRAWSWHDDRFVEGILRYDIPATPWALGAGANYSHSRPYVRVYEVGRNWEGPIYTWAFVEHKDVLGLTVNLQVFNLNNGRRRMWRTVYAGPRDGGVVRFAEDRNELIGPIFRLEVKGKF